MARYVESQHFPALDPVFSWPTAARFATELKEKIQLMVAGHPATGGEAIRAVMGALGKKRHFGLALSNLG